MDFFFFCSTPPKFSSGSWRQLKHIPSFKDTPWTWLQPCLGLCCTHIFMIIENPSPSDSLLTSSYISTFRGHREILLYLLSGCCSCRPLTVLLIAACNVVSLKIDVCFTVVLIMSLFVCVWCVCVCVCVCSHLIFLLETVALSTFHLSDVLEEVGNLMFSSVTWWTWNVLFIYSLCHRLMFPDTNLWFKTSYKVSQNVLY